MEFAIVLPVLLSLIFGCIEFSVYLYNRHMLTHACREATRAGIVMTSPRTTQSVQTLSANQFNTVINSPGLISFTGSAAPTRNITLTLADAGGVFVSFGDSLTVSASYTHNFLFLANLGIGPIIINAQSIMRME